MNVSLMKKPTTNKFFILLIYLLIQACSASNEEKGVVSSEDISTRQGWDGLNAVSKENVYFLDENLANNWGVNTVDLIKTLSIVLGT